MKIELIGGSAMVINYGDQTLRYTLGNLIHPKNLNGNDTFKILMKYLDYKGDEYKDILFNRLSVAQTAILNTIHNRELVHVKEIGAIIDIIDVLDIFDYIKNVYRFRHPSKLKEEFTQKDIDDGRWNRDQTLVVSEYLELVSLSVALKMVIGPIALFVYHNYNKKDDNKDYGGFKFIRTSKLFNSPPMVKAYSFIKRLVDQSPNTNIIVIDKGLSKDELPAYLLSIYCFQKLAPATLLNENDVNNIVNMLFNHTQSKLRPGGDVSRAIRNKSTVLEGGDDGSNGSVAEAYKATSDVSPGQVVEYNWAVDTINKVMHNSYEYITKYVDKKDVKYILSRIHLLKEAVISEEAQNILSIIFKDTIPPQAIKQLKYVAEYKPTEGGPYVSPLLNLVVIGYAYLRGIGLPQLARLITSKECKADDEEDVIILNPTNSKTRISPAEKEELQRYYLDRDIGANRVNMTEEWVNATANSYYSKTWLAIDDQPEVEVLCSNIRNLLCSLVITIAKDREIEMKERR